MTRVICLLFCLFAATLAHGGDRVEQGLRIPDGFEVVEFAGSDLANDIYTLTLGPDGSVLVSGRGYIRRLVDRDDDGKADQAVTFAHEPRDGAMGLLWERNTLYFTGDGGLRRLRDADGDGAADGPSELIRKLKTGGEHDAHAIRRGPDGRLYVLCGNSTGVDASFAQSPDSPIKTPIAGCVLRFDHQMKQSAIIADGFRNPYDMDFNPAGDLFTYDSDNERCVSLPWYEGTRFYHVRFGGHHGWQSPQRGQFWRMPPYFPDTVKPVADLGRGSPTACICYRHAQFPAEYRGGFFLADWTFGRIWFVPLERRGASYVGTPRVFLQSVGDNGFAPTALAVNETNGDLFISIGGRGTRGAIYRVRYTSGFGKVAPQELARLRPSSSAQTNPPSRPASWQPLPLDRAAEVVGNRGATREERLAACRSLQIGLGDLTARSAHGTVWEGYSLRDPLMDRKTRLNASVALRQAFPAGDSDLDRELSRCLSLLEDDHATLPSAMLGTITPSSSPIEDIHYLIVLGRLRGPWEEGLAKRVAAALLALDHKIRQANLTRDRNWPLRIAELHAELARRHPEIQTALLDHEEFGRPDHALFARADSFDRRRAAQRFLERASQTRDYPWSAEVVEVVSVLPDERVLPLFRQLWERGGLEDALLRQFARRPEESDRDRFLGGLRSPQLSLVRLCLEAIEKLPPRKDGNEALTLLRCLRSLPTDREAVLLKQRLVAALERSTGQTGLGDAPQRWSEWFLATYPKLAPRLEGADGVDVAAWKKRLLTIPWAEGDGTRGAAIYQKANCAACHSGAQALGPDLRGVAGRFSRDDLFTAILQPSRDISPRYRTTAISLVDGKTHQGMVIYEAVDSLILQTGSATTVRLPVDRIESRRVTEISLMPAGLLDGLKDHEIADLYMHLKAMRN